MNKKLVFLIAMIIIALTTPAFAVPERGLTMLNQMRFGLYLAQQNLYDAHMILRQKAEIGLTDEQEKKIENMMLAYEETAIRRQAEIKILETKFAALLGDQKIDRKEMEKMARDLGKLKTDHEVDHLNYLLNVREVLTPEQLKKLETMRSNLRHGLRERFMNRREGRQ